MKKIILFVLLFVYCNSYSQDLREYYNENKSSNLSYDSILKDGSDIILSRNEEIYYSLAK